LLLRGCVGVVAGTEPLTAGLMESLPGLKVISRCGSGMDNVNMPAAEKCGIAVLNTPDGPTLAVAELTLGYALALLRKVNHRILRRNVKNTVMLNGFKVLNKLDLKFSVNNIMGFPTETRHLTMDTVRLNRQVNADSANAYSFSPFHGTPLRKMSEDLGYCERNLIARSATRPTLLKMPQFPPEAIEGLRRCFTFYVHMPESRWSEIKKAEVIGQEGNRIWEDLRKECLEKYFDFS